MAAQEIVNRVAQSALITLDLEQLRPPGERVLFDIRPLLYEGLIIREKDVRQFVREHDWSQYKDKNVALVCTADAVVPTWVYMLLAASLTPWAQRVVAGGLDVLEAVLFADALAALDPEQYRDARVVIKGCSVHAVPPSAYAGLVSLLQPFAASIMYGEPCSTVPVYKRKAAAEK
jgi:hypothetical protein